MLSKTQYVEIINEIKKEQPNLNKVKCLLRLNEENLKHNSVHEFETKLWLNFKDDYQGILIIIKSNMGKDFAFYIPHKFEQTSAYLYTGK